MVCLYTVNGLPKICGSITHFYARTHSILFLPFLMICLHTMTCLNHIFSNYSICIMISARELCNRSFFSSSSDEKSSATQTRLIIIPCYILGLHKQNNAYHPSNPLWSVMVFRFGFMICTIVMMGVTSSMSRVSRSSKPQSCSSCAETLICSSAGIPGYCDQFCSHEQKRNLYSLARLFATNISSTHLFPLKRVQLSDDTTCFERSIL